MLVGVGMASICSLSFLWPLRISWRRCCFTSLSAPSSTDFPQLEKECKDFLPWLQRKAGFDISSTLSLGISIYGRSLYASNYIEAGECILKVPYSAQITPDKILPEIETLLSDDVGSVSRLAVVLLTEKKLGQDSEWAPYINSLPRISEMHNTVFWSKDELEMVRQSTVYHETNEEKAYIEKEFSAIRPVLEQFPQFFGGYKIEDFMHTYALVVSRAWRTSKGISLIPFADFLNHDGASEAVLLSDDHKEISEVIADRSYVCGEQVLIRYGKFSNATLVADFGFTLPYNIHDQVQVWIDLPLDDTLYLIKLELLHKFLLPTITNPNGFNSSGSSFIVKEVKSASGKGKGIPQALRAFARVLSTVSTEDLKYLAVEAALNDGRLARTILKNKDSEIRAHRLLLSRFNRMIEEHDAAIKKKDGSRSPGRRASHSDIS